MTCETVRYAVALLHCPALLSWYMLRHCALDSCGDRDTDARQPALGKYVLATETKKNKYARRHLSTHSRIGRCSTGSMAPRGAPLKQTRQVAAVLREATETAAGALHQDLGSPLTTRIWVPAIGK